jgi:hypothetical protein
MKDKERVAIISGTFTTIAACIGAIAVIAAGAWVLIQPRGATPAVQATSTYTYAAPTSELSQPSHPTSVPLEANAPTESSTVPAPERPTLAPTDTPLSRPQPTVPPQVPASFSDNFDNGASSEWESYLGTWRVIDGEYTADHTNRPVYSLVGNIGWRDYAVDVDVTSSCQAGYPITVLVRSVDAGNGIQMQVTCCSVKWTLYEYGNSHTIASKEGVGVELLGRCFGDCSSSWHTTHVRVEARGDFYSVYLDGVRMLDVQDGTFQYGKTGIGLSCPPGEGCCPRFDDFQVSALP